MTSRSWILALGAGLCVSLPACTMPQRNGAAPTSAMLANSNEPSATDNAAEQSSPYAVIPHSEKLAKPTQSAISSQELVSQPPYTFQSKQLEPPPPEPPSAMPEWPAAPTRVADLKPVPPLPPEPQPAPVAKVLDSPDKAS